MLCIVCCVLYGVYCMVCMICDDVYICETGRLVRERLKKHYCEAKMMAVKTPGDNTTSMNIQI